MHSHSHSHKQYHQPSAIRNRTPRTVHRRHTSLSLSFKSFYGLWYTKQVSEYELRACPFAAVQTKQGLPAKHREKGPLW